MPSPSARSLIQGYVLLHASSGVAVGMTQLALPLFALHLGASAPEIGAIRAVAGAGLLLTAIPAGFVIDRFGSALMFHLGNGAGILFCLLMPRIDSLFVLLVALGAEGIARSVKFNALSSSFYRALPAMGVDKVGWPRGSFSIGLGFAGPLLGGLLIGRGDFVTVFAIAAAIQLVPSLIFTRLSQTHPRGDDRPHLSEGFGGAARAYLDLLAHRDVAAALGAEAIGAGCFCVFSTFIGVAAISELGLPAWTSALFIAAEGLAYILTLFLLARLAQSRTYRVAALTGLGLIVVALTGVSLSTRLEALVGFSALLGIGLGVLNLVSSTRAATHPGEKGKVAALFATAVSVGIVVAPLIAGFVAGLFGARAVFVAFVPLCLLLAAFSARSRPELAPEAAEVPEAAEAA